MFILPFLFIISFLFLLSYKFSQLRKCSSIILFSMLIIIFTACSANASYTSENNNVVEATENNTEVNDKDNTEELEKQAEAEKKKADEEKAKKEKKKQEKIAEEAAKTKKKKSKKKKKKKTLPEMKVHFIDVGQADAALVELDEFKILIDSGDWLGNETVDYLHQQGIENIDLIIGSHPHADHIGQIDKVIEQFPVGEVWMSGDETTSKVFERVMTAIDEKDIGYDEPRAGDEFELGKLKVDVFSPSSLSGNLNDDSIVLKMTYGAISFLFTGDAEKNAESQMLNGDYPLESTILKVGHHGSDTSNTPAFIKKVNPEVAVISVAEKSKYSHPDQSVLDTLKKQDLDLYATKSHGNILVTTNGKDYNITTDKTGKVTAGVKKAKKEKKTKKKKTKKKDDDPPPPANANCIDINTASESEVQGIIHIGPARAADLINLRPYDSVDDLTKIKGIAAARIADIKAEGIACVN